MLRNVHTVPAHTKHVSLARITARHHGRCELGHSPRTWLRQHRGAHPPHARDGSEVGPHHCRYPRTMTPSYHVLLPLLFAFSERGYIFAEKKINEITQTQNLEGLPAHLPCLPHSLQAPVSGLHVRLPPHVYTPANVNTHLHPSPHKCSDLSKHPSALCC